MTYFVNFSKEVRGIVFTKAIAGKRAWNLAKNDFSPSLVVKKQSFAPYCAHVIDMPFGYYASRVCVLQFGKFHFGGCLIARAIPKHVVDDFYTCGKWMFGRWLNGYE